MRHRTTAQREELMAQLEIRMAESERLYQNLSERIVDREAELADRNRELQDCMQELADKADQLQAVTDENRRLVNQLDQLGADNDQLRKDLRQRDWQFEELRRDTRREAQAVEERERALEQVGAQFRKVQDDFDLLKEAYEEKEETIALLKEQMRVDLDAQGAIFNGIVDKRTAENKALQAELESAREQLRRSGDAGARFREAEARLTDLEYQNRQLQQQLAGAQEEHAQDRIRLEEDHQRRMDACSGEHRAAALELQDALDSVRAQLVRRNEEVQALREECDRLGGDRERVLRDLEDSQGRLQTQDGQLRERLADQAAEISALRERLGELESDVEQRDRDLAAMLAENRELQEQRDLALRDVRMLDEQAKRDDQQMDRLVLERNSVAEANDTLSREVELLQQELRRRDDGEGRDAAASSAALLDAQRQLEEARAALEASKSELQAAKAQEQQVREELAAAEQRAEAAKREREEAGQGAAELLKDRLEQRTQELRDREREIEELKDQLAEVQSAFPSPPAPGADSAALQERLTAAQAQAAEAEEGRRQAESDIEYLEQMLEQVKDEQLQACQVLGLAEHRADGKDKTPAELMEEIKGTVLRQTRDLEILDDSRNRSRRQKDEVIALVLEDPALDDFDWPDDGSSDDDLSDHPSGGARWLKARNRIRKLTDRYPQLERRKDDLKRKVRSTRERSDELQEQLNAAMDRIAELEQSQSSVPRSHGGDRHRRASRAEDDAYASRDERYQEYDEHEVAAAGRLPPRLVTLGLSLDPRRSADRGVLVTEVARDSAAYQAQIQAGDRIVEFDSNRIDSAAELKQLLRQLSPGDTAPVRLVRNRRTLSVTVVADAAPAAVPHGPVAGGGADKGRKTPTRRRASTSARESATTPARARTSHGPPGSAPRPAGRATRR
eukprot:TRINITY_DN6860_c0_g1_i2.p1 TRINITY_DN6860_c0_g1~~TRINITY_DN6860_c0_g1_i2.p1  ORF type:complete len:971 (+),score=390.37 TRINITY_DN6860_c0_g1_i2:190-2913(+)